MARPQGRQANGVNGHGHPAPGAQRRTVVVTKEPVSLSERFKKINQQAQHQHRPAPPPPPPPAFHPHPPPRHHLRPIPPPPHRRPFPPRAIPGPRGGGIYKSPVRPVPYAPRGGAHPPFRGGRGGFAPRGLGFRGARGGGTAYRGRGGAGFRGGFRGGSSFRGRGAGGRGGGGFGGARTKEELDKQMDQYMLADPESARWKLDEQLDEYMAQQNEGDVDMQG
ncbi:hypothetical protein HDV00_009561 [Rhizophlyctis rosea]|nr:hypothetical protein HDV00_009561 [Rhizophlyctis rosea]